MDALVTTEWLAERLGDPMIRIVNAAGGSVTSRGTGLLDLNLMGDARKDFEANHIPGAVLVNFDVLSDRTNPVPNMLPSLEAFSRAVGNLGISNDHNVIVYDCIGVRVSPRVWWMFRTFGHDKVAILDGGLPKWAAEGRPLESGTVTHEPCNFSGIYRRELVRDAEQVIEIQKTRTEQIVDGRPIGRYKGDDPEPRPDIPSGHMPWSVNVPVELIVDPTNGTLFPVETIATNFKKAGVNISEPITASCGWGIAACTVAFGLYLLGQSNTAVYDGSWVDWASRGDTEIVTN